MKTYRHLFFDLDRTLWDFEKNAHETLTELFDKHQLKERGIADVNTFITTYKRINEMHWAEYRGGKITKEYLRTIRFQSTFEHFSIQDEALAHQVGEEYIAICPVKSHVFPHTYETLDYLAGRYELHIITNGFEEVQDIKMRHSGLERYFDVIVTSEKVGHKKPDARVFQYALQATGAVPGESLMIGDDAPVDLVGARNVGIDQVYFNPERLPNSESFTFEIHSLATLQELL